MQMPKRIVFDIETAGRDFDSLDPSTQEYLLKWADSDEEARKVRESLALYPLTGEIIAIGMLDPDTMRGAVYYQNPGEQRGLPLDEDGLIYEGGTESEILTRFWQSIKTCEQFITFNGRGFDCPFIIIRSAVCRIKPTRDLMPNRYHAAHIDLLDQLTFFGAAKRRFSLDMWCRTFGIASPKAKGITGLDVRDLYASRRFLDIARYCGGDVKATRELLRIWEEYMRSP